MDAPTPDNGQQAQQGNNERATLRKHERVSNFRTIHELFCGGSAQSFSAYPIRLLVLPSAGSNSILVSVPKRHFKHAVDRNRIKRQIREAYRRNKTILSAPPVDAKDGGAAMAFIWISSQKLSSKEVDQRVVRLLKKVAGNKR